MVQITSLAHHNYIFKKLGKMTWAWGSRKERGERDRWERGVETARERMKERTKEKERRLRTVLSLFKCFSKSIKMYWALRQQPKSSSKLYVEKTGIIPQVSTMIYNNMNESWFWQSSIYLMKNLLKRKKKSKKKTDRRLARTSMNMIAAFVYLSLNTIWLVTNIFFPVFWLHYSHFESAKPWLSASSL